MNRSPLLPLLALSLAAASPPARAVVPSHPPVARTAPVTDDYFGQHITDPYRWMESEPQPAFNDYLHGQNDFARATLARIPGRDALANDIAAVSGLAARARTVELAHGRIFYLKREAGAQIDKLYVRDAAGHETLLVDPSKLDAGGKHAEIDQFAPPSTAASWPTASPPAAPRTARCTSSRPPPSSSAPTRSTAPSSPASLAPRRQRFFFDRLPASSLTAQAVDKYAHQVVFRHMLGTDPATDTIVLDSDHLPFPFKSAATFPSVASTPGSDWLIAAVSDGVSPETAFAVARLADVLAGHPAWKQLASQSDEHRRRRRPRRPHRPPDPQGRAPLQDHRGRSRPPPTLPAPPPSSPRRPACSPA